MKKGLFISFEGIDASGKSTVINTMKTDSRFKNYLFTREPGGTGAKISEEIRAIILDKNNLGMHPKTEALLYAASRAQHLYELILPNLEQGRDVITDRYLDSSVIYQGISRGLPASYIKAINDFILPDLTFVFLISLEEMKERLKQRGKLDRLDLEDDSFYKNVINGYQELIDSDKRFISIDATNSPQEIVENIYESIKKYERQK